MKKPTLAKLKKKLDQVFSKWIRQRGADEGGTNECVTCGALKFWKELQCGHYYSRKWTALRWDERNCWPQCLVCNVFLGGNYPSYARYMLSELGQKTLDDLDSAHRVTTKLSRADVEAMIEKYQGE